jgi:thiol:disulfide interchange protein DsbD
MIGIVRRLLAMAGLLLGLVGVALAQPGGSAAKVTWTVRGDTLAPGKTGAVTLRASIAKGWKMYAPASPPPSVGVSVLGVTSDPSGVNARGDSLVAIGATTAYDPNFGKDVHFLSGEARLRLPLSMSTEARPGTHWLRGTLQFMVCTEEICLPPDTESFEAMVVATD